MGRRRNDEAPARTTLTRRSAVGLLGTAAAVTAVGATAAVAAPGTPRQAMARLTGGTGSPGATPGASAAPPPAVPLGSRSAPEASGAPTTSPRYQGSVGGATPTVTTAAVTQPPTVLSLDAAKHLGRRATWGLTPGVVTAIRAAGPAAWVAAQLKPASIKDPTVDRMLTRLETIGKTPAQLLALNESREDDDYWYAHTELEQAALIRATWSNRQLFEVVVDFFHSRLHVPSRMDKSRNTLNHYDAQVIRKHALGRFEAMLWAMLTHPAMIVYLDNQENTKFGGNQNLGRELLELHTLGVDAGYTQKDVAGVSRLLTGLSVDRDTLKMVYRPEQHYVGRVTVFGHVFANASAANGLTAMRNLVKFLAHHPKTAEYLALDLARRFVSDAPPKALVARLAKTYLANDTAMVPVLKQLFGSPEFKASVGQKFRRPMENTIATMRVLGIRPLSDWDTQSRGLRDLRWTLETMGNTPYGHTTPDGYADFAQPWLSTVGTLARWNMQMAFSGSWFEGFTQPAVSAWLDGATTYGAAVDKLAIRLLMQKPTTAQRNAVLAFLGRARTDPLTASARRDDYNLRVRVPALLLGAPTHQLR